MSSIHDVSPYSLYGSDSYSWLQRDLELELNDGQKSSDHLKAYAKQTDTDSVPSFPSKQSRPKDVLRDWIIENPEVIYPDTATKTVLSGLTGWTVKQVSTWFANYRQRYLKLPHSISMQTSGTPQDLPEQDDSSSPPNEAIFHHVNGYSSSHRSSSYRATAPSSPRNPPSASAPRYDISKREQNPDKLLLALGFRAGFAFITSWRSTLPISGRYDQIEDEEEKKFIADDLLQFVDHRQFDDYEPDEGWKIHPGSTAADMIKLYNTTSLSGLPDVLKKLKRSMPARYQTPTSKKRRTSSNRSDNSYKQPWNDHDGSSATSYGTTSSSASNRSSVSRRGRRLWQPNMMSSKPHHCPKCSQGFVRECDMKRHMASICSPVCGWMCRPIKYQYHLSGLPNFGAVQAPLCYCGSYPWDCDHTMLQCWTKAENERTFYRIDHIKRHLRDTHRLATHMAGIDLMKLRTNHCEESAEVNTPLKGHDMASLDEVYGALNLVKGVTKGLSSMILDVC